MSNRVETQPAPMKPAVKARALRGKSAGSHRGARAQPRKAAAKGASAAVAPPELFKPDMTAFADATR